MRHYISLPMDNHFKVKQTMSDISTNVSTIKPQMTLDICTNQKVQEYNLMHGYFPGNGSWESGKDGTPSSDPEWLVHWKVNAAILNTTERCFTNISRFISSKWYSPRLCKMRKRFLNKRELSRCLYSEKATRIVTVGDSNSARYNDGILSLVEDILETSCRAVKAESDWRWNESLTIDHRYFMDYDQDYKMSNATSKSTNLKFRQSRTNCFGFL